MDQRTIDLDADPDDKQEIRLRSDDCIVTIWLPAGIAALSRAMQALSDAGFDIPEQNGR